MTFNGIVKAPEKGHVFIEDLPEEEQVIAVGHTAGLLNLGNTCCMNSTIQCLLSVPDLKSDSTSYPSERRNDLDPTSHMLTTATRELLNDLDRSVRPVMPTQFWMAVPRVKKSQLTGVCELVAVLTHKGRSADLGHYTAWVKQENGKQILFGDDNPLPQREEDITKLSGGGDWHMAYICIYEARYVPM